MNSLFQQIRQLWSQLGINQRVTLAVTGMSVVVGMVALVAWSQRPQMQLLYGRLSPKDVSSVMASIQELGIKSEMGANGTAIYVSSDQVYKARMALAAKGIPSGDGVGFEIFDRGNFGVSDFIQRTNYTRAIQGELGRTIGQLQGVRSAKVMVVIPENKLLFTDARTKPTASVMIEGSLNAEQVNSVRFLVAGSVEGLKPEDVTVVDNRGQNLTEGLRDDPLMGPATAQMRLRRQAEEYFARKVESMLATVLGPNQAVVRVSAELETEAVSVNSEKFDPEGQVVRNETTQDDTSTTNESEPSSQPVGATANINTEAGSNKTSKNTETAKKNKTTSFEINKVVTNSMKAPGSVSRLSATVIVAPTPDIVAAKDPAKRQPLVEARKAMLLPVVANALGIKATPALLKELVSIEVADKDFYRAPDSSSWMDSVSQNSDLLRDAGAVLVAVILFGAFVRMLGKTKPDEIPMEMLTAQSETENQGVLTNNKASSQSAFTQPVTVELINDMIRRKPDNIGAALKNWMETDSKT
ncbi:MAG: flagellar M-ring protein FliF [Verrucomicrobia bacterium]|nr:flagellar M-ring protein FliF [Verrucomicrobiota bacterium]